MKPLVLELFAGCGGAGLGIRNACPEALHVGIEWDHTACLTRKAAGLHTIRADVAQYPTEPFVGKVWGLWASPPCPDFSPAGRRKGIEGESGHLIFQVPRWVEATRPEWFACEQVPPVLDWWKSFADDFRALGYSCWAGILCAADFGVPQERYRAILMASRTKQVQPPERTHAENPQADLFGAMPQPWVSMAEGLGWGAMDAPCPTVTSGGTKSGGAEPLARGGRERLTHTHTHRNAGYRRTRGSGVSERHGSRPDTPADRPAPTLTSKARCDELILRTGNNTMRTSRTGSRAGDGGVERYERETNRPAPVVDCNAGSKWTLVNRRDSDAWVEQHGDRPNRDVEQVGPTITAEGHRWFWQWERPSTTVCADSRIAAPGYRTGTQRSLTPSVTAAAAAAGDQTGTEAIKLTVQDALLLQGFPADYPVQGSRTAQFSQIGNACPPAFVEAIIRSLVEGTDAS